ncbi:hypothetical protein EVAR_84893_1 [Eumeta japonica]|uniref:Uncharacterized protein n=1 Tax=Eumeta variegata TaxID=151549 RepID=A0A4C1YIT6_EUMVA|nr:hypothetical protein EVAR_84893_1 [Eumeta japonica]
MRLKGKVVVEPLNADPSILIGLALIRANEDAALLVKIGLTRILILGTYAPDMSKPLEEREEFWADLRDILVKCDKTKRVVILNGFNGKGKPKPFLVYGGKRLEYFGDMIRDDDGHLLNEENNVKERYKNNFESIFDNITATECMIDNGNEREITMDEIMRALKSTKVGKAARYDRVLSEMERWEYSGKFTVPAL